MKILAIQFYMYFIIFYGYYFTRNLYAYFYSFDLALFLYYFRISVIFTNGFVSCLVTALSNGDKYSLPLVWGNKNDLQFNQ